MRCFRLAAVAMAVCIPAASSLHADEAFRPRRGPSRGPQGVFRTDVPTHVADVILCRPTATSVTLSVLSYSDRNGYVAYGARRGTLRFRTKTRSMKKDEPVAIVLDKLKADTRYYYELRDAKSDEPILPKDVAGTFHTRRSSGSAFTFTVQADSHLDEATSPDLYRRTLGNVVADVPDFHIDLGDTFMTDKHATRDSAARQYLAQRYYLGLVGRSAPVFLVLGNHDGEEAKLLRGGADSLAVWSNRMRKRYFPNPVPDGFYTGNKKREPFVGLLQDYYAWQWGDALLVVLDPFWFTPRRRRGEDNWTHTLGTEQYHWLKKTLEDSKASLKFVFIHHLVGGLDDQCRGGAEAARLYEWGGRNADETDGFRKHRPRWDSPIHPLLLKHGVSAVFHGHDHFFSHQELDGIAYVLVPQPGHRSRRERSMTGEYGYVSGKSLSGAGHIRVKVSRTSATMEYVRALLPADERGARRNGQVVYRCVLGKGEGARRDAR